MLRKLLLPLSAIILLGGCMTGGYNYRQDSGDYYYGQPGTSYRYHDQYGNGGYYDNRYRYPGYSPGYGVGGSLYYGRGYGYGGYPYGYYRPPVIVVRPGGGHDNGHRPPPPQSGDRDRAPWRDYERLQRERIQRSTPPPVGNRTSPIQRGPIPAQVRPAVPANRPAASAPRPAASNRGSKMDRMIRQARPTQEK